MKIFLIVVLVLMGILSIAALVLLCLFFGLMAPYFEFVKQIFTKWGG